MKFIPINSDKYVQQTNRHTEVFILGPRLRHICLKFLFSINSNIHEARQKPSYSKWWWKNFNRQGKTVAFQWVPSHVGIHGNETADLLAKKATILQNKQQTPLNFETIKRLIKQRTQKKFSQEAIASSNKTQWQNIKTTWENNKNKPRKQAVANFRLNTGHDCLSVRLHRIEIFSYNNIYLLQLGCYPVAVVILRVNKTWTWLLPNLSREGYMRSM